MYINLLKIKLQVKKQFFTFSTTLIIYSSKSNFFTKIMRLLQKIEWMRLLLLSWSEIQAFAK